MSKYKEAKRARGAFDRVDSRLMCGVLTGFFAVVLAMFVYYGLYQCSPAGPGGANTIEMCEHGDYFYITRWQAFLFRGLLHGGWLTGMGFGIARELHRRRHKKLLAEIKRI